MKKVLLVFAKEPIPGKVKTRLAQTLGSQRSADLYRNFLMDTLDLSRRVAVDRRVVAYDALGTKAKFIRKHAKGFELIRQKGKNLGERMLNAAKSVNKNEIAYTVLIGSDSPNIPLQYIKHAFRKLKNCDVVIGPADDGGYYLLGFKATQRAIFANIPWSTGRVLDKTSEKIKKANLTLMELPFWYDVDDKESLQRLKNELLKEKSKHSFWTKKYLTHITDE